MSTTTTINVYASEADAVNAYTVTKENGETKITYTQYSDGVKGAEVDLSGAVLVNSAYTASTVLPTGFKFGENAFANMSEAASKVEANGKIYLGGANAINAASSFVKDATITGEASVDWSQGWFFIGRSTGTTAEDATVTFQNATITSVSLASNKSTGFHVSGEEAGDAKKKNGTLIIDNSSIVVDYMINKNVVQVIGDGNAADDEVDLYVKNGFGIGGRPAIETPDGEDATALLEISNGAYVKIDNENGMGIGNYTSGEAKGKMLISGGSVFESERDLNVREKGLVDVTNSEMKIATTLTNFGTVKVNDGTLSFGTMATSTNGSNATNAQLFITGTSTITGNEITGDTKLRIGQVDADNDGVADRNFDDTPVVTENNKITFDVAEMSFTFGNIYNTEVTLNKDTAITMTGVQGYGYMYVTGSTFDLQGHTLTHNGALMLDAVIKNGTLDFNGEGGEEGWSNIVFQDNASTIEAGATVNVKTGSALSVYEDLTVRGVLNDERTSGNGVSIGTLWVDRDSNGKIDTQYSNGAVLTVSGTGAKFTTNLDVTVTGVAEQALNDELVEAFGADAAIQESAFILKDGATAEIGGTFTNAGTISVNGSAFTAATVANAGVFNISGTASVVDAVFSGEGKTTFTDVKIEGNWDIGGSQSEWRFVGDSVINEELTLSGKVVAGSMLSDDEAADFVPTSSKLMINADAAFSEIYIGAMYKDGIEKDAEGKEIISTVTVANNAKVEINKHGGAGLAIRNSGVLNIGADSTVSVKNDIQTIIQGTMNVYGTFTNTDINSTNYGPFTVYKGGTVTVYDGGTVSLGKYGSDGTLPRIGLNVDGKSDEYNSGYLNINAGGTVEAKGNLTVNRTGQITNNGNLTIAETLTNNGTVSVNGGSFTAAAVANESALNVTGGDVTITGSITNNGTMTVDTASTLRADAITGSGTVNIVTADMPVLTNNISKLIDVDSVIGNTITLDGAAFVNGMTIGTTGLYLAQSLSGDIFITATDREVLFVDSTYTEETAAAAGLILGFNAFTTVKDALAMAATIGGEGTTHTIRITGTSAGNESGTSEILYTAGGTINIQNESANHKLPAVKFTNATVNVNSDAVMQSLTTSENAVINVVEGKLTLNNGYTGWNNSRFHIAEGAKVYVAGGSFFLNTGMSSTTAGYSIAGTLTIGDHQANINLTPDGTISGTINAGEYTWGVNFYGKTTLTGTINNARSSAVGWPVSDPYYSNGENVGDMFHVAGGEYHGRDTITVNEDALLKVTDGGIVETANIIFATLNRVSAMFEADGSGSRVTLSGNFDATYADTVKITNGAAVSANSVKFGADTEVTLSGAGTLSAADISNSGTVTVDGVLTADGTLTNSAEGTITVNSNGFSAGTLNNNGLITVNSDYITVGTVNGSGTIAMSLGSHIKWSGDLDGLISLDVSAYTDGDEILVFDFTGNTYTGSAAGLEALYMEVLGGAYSTNYFKIVNGDLYYYRPDVTAPIAPVLTPDTTDPTNQSVIVTAQFSETDSVKEYSLDGIRWTVIDPTAIETDLTWTYNFGENGKIYFRETDLAGNTSNVSIYEVTNIDKIAPAEPAASASITSITNQDVIVTAVFSDDSVIKQYSTDGGTTWQNYTGSIIVTENCNVSFKGTDAAGNTSTVHTLEITNIDKIAPDAPANITMDHTTATNESVKITAVFSDDSVIKQYSFDGTTWELYADGVTMTANGTIYFRGIDKAGNISNVVSKEVHLIDTDAPDAPVVSANANPTNQPVVVTATFSADTATMAYKIGDGEWTTFVEGNSDGVTLVDGKLQYTVGTDANGTTIIFRGTDAAGNSSETSYKVDNIDTTPATLVISGNPDQLTSLDVTLTATATDAHGATIFYSFDNVNWLAYSGEVVVDSNRSVFFKAIDGAGNVTTQEVVVSKIDKDAPAISITGNAADWTNKNVVLLATTEAGATVEYSIDGGKNWIDYKATGVVMEENGTVIFKVTDSVGNVTTQEIVVDKIDKEDPAINITGNATDWTNQSITLTGTTSDDAVIYYSTTNSDDPADWKALGTGLIVDANGTYYFKAVDKAGNETVFAPVVVDKIDKNKPVVTITGNATAPTNQNVTLDAAVEDASNTAVIYYSFDNESWSVYSGSLTIDSNKTVFFKAIDAAGNVSVITPVKVDQIDKTGPAAPIVSADTTAPAQTVTVSAVFAADAATIYYSTDGINWTPYTGDSAEVTYDAATRTLSVTVDSNKTVYFKSADALGNESVSGSWNVTNVDRTAPTIHVTGNAVDWTNQDVILTVTNGEGLDVFYTVTYADGTTRKGVVADGGKLSVSANATVEFTSKDAAGNTATYTENITFIDKTAPVMTISGDTTTVTAGNVELTVGVTDNLDAANVKVYYSFDNISWELYDATGKVIVDKNTMVYFKAVDKLGNESFKVVEVGNIDKVAPEAPVISADTTDPVQSKTGVVISAAFGDTDAVKIEYFNGKNWVEYTGSITVTENGTISFRAIDAVGNVSKDVSYDVTNIDDAEPVLTFASDVTAATNGSVNVTAEANETLSSLTYTIAYADGTSVSGIYTGAIEMIKNGTITFTATDVAGNVTETTYDVTNIDTDAPAAPTATADSTPTNGNVKVTATFDAAATDIAVNQYSLDGINWYTYDAANGVVMSENGKVYFRSIDKAGNISDVGSYDVANIDRTAPTAPVISASAEATNESVVVSAAFSADTVTFQYSTDGINWTTYTGDTASVVKDGNTLKFTVDSNSTVSFRGMDEAGNISAQTSYTVSNIDKDAPALVITGNATEWTNSNVTLIASSETGAKIEYFNGTDWVAYNAATGLVIEANGSYEFRVSDAAGNTTAQTVVVDKIDKDAPTLDITGNATDWTNKDVTLSATVSDGTVYYSYDNANWQVYTGNVVVDSNKTVFFKAVDAAGNVTVADPVVVSKIDKTAAVLTLSADKTAPTNDKVVVSLTANEAGTIRYQINGGEWKTDYVDGVEMTANGTVTFEFTDAAGNVTTGSYDVTNFDDAEPVLTFASDVTAATNGSVNVTAEANETLSSLTYTIAYADGTSVSGAYTGAIEMTKNGTITFTATDVAGNVTTTDYVVSNIDKTAPALVGNITADIATATNGNVTVTAAYDSTAAKIEYSLDGKTWYATTGAVEMTANGLVYFRAIDALGNVSGVSSYEVTNIDKVAPALAISGNATDWTNSDVTLTATTEAGLTIEYSIDYTDDTIADVINATVGTDGKINVEGNGIVTITTTDAAGNKTTQTVVVDKIDKIAPDAPVATSDNTATTGNVTVTAAFSSDTAVKQYSTDGGVTWINYVDGVIMTDNGTVQFRSIDKAGNISDVTSHTVSNIDRVAPVLSGITADVATATNGNVTVTAAYDSTAAKIEYSLDGKTWYATTGAVEMTANGLVYFRAIDALGNVSGVSSYEVTNIDKVAPEAPVVSADITAATNGKVYVSAGISESGAKIEYFNGKAWVEYTGAIEFTENGTVSFRAIDAVGNISGVVTYEVTNIDKAAPAKPVAAADITAATSKNVVVTADFSDDSTVKQYKIGTGEWQTYTGAITMTENGTVSFRAQDAAGNWTDVVDYVVNNIDKDAPVLAIDGITSTPTANDVILTANVTDVNTTAIYYSFDNVNWIVYNNGVTVDSNKLVYFKAVDSVGNETVQTVEVSNIDKTAPALSVTGDLETPINSSVELTVVAGEGAEVTYTVTYENGITESGTVSGGKFAMMQNGTVIFTTADALGNATSQTVVVGNIDTAIPDAPVAAANLTTLTNGNVLVTAVFSSDSVVKQFSTDGGNTWQTYTGSIEMVANGMISFRGIDAAGNESAVTSYDVTNIDKTAPALTSLTAPTAATNGDVIVSAVYDADAKVIQYSFDGATWMVTTDGTVTMSANGTVYFRAIDQIGNISTVSSYEVTNIDKVAPAFNGFTADDTLTNGNVTVTAAFDSTATKIEYSLDGKTWLVAANGAFDMVANGTIYFRATDELGNVSDVVSYEVTNIDKKDPVISVSGNTSDITNSDVILTATVTDDSSVKLSYIISDVALDEAALAGVASWNDYKGGVAVSENNSFVYFKAVDAAGNVTYQVSEVTNIDKVAPTAPATSADITAATNGAVTVTAVFSGDSVVKQYSLDGINWFTYNTNGVTMTENGTVQFRGFDAAGNVSGISSYEVTNIDKIAPEAPVASADTLNATDKVTVSATFSNDTVLKQFSYNGKDWIEYTAGIEFTANGTVYFRGKDEAGNWSTVTSYVVGNIDTTNPSLSVSGNAMNWTNSDVILTVANGEGLEISYTMTYTDGTEVTGKIADGSQLVVDKNATVVFTVTDAAGNATSQTVVIDKIDKTAPDAPAATADITSATNGAVVVTATFSSDSVVKQYSLDGINWLTYNVNGVTMTENGTVQFRGIDAAGNISEVVSKDINNIDRTAPAVSINGNAANWTKNDVTLTATSEAGATIEYTINGTDWIVYEAAKGVVMTENGTVIFKVTDAAGNVTTQEVVVDKIDKNAPEAPVVSADITEATNGSVLVSATFSADTVTKQYFNGTEWVTYTGAIKVDANDTTVQFRGIDAAGNISEVVSYTVSNIDKAAPTAPTAKADLTDPTNSNVTVTATFDTASDVIANQYSLDGVTWLAYTGNGVVMTANGTVYFRSIDQAGNISAVGSYTVSNIDKVAPDAPVAVANTLNAAQSVTVSASFSSDSVVKEYSLDGKEWKVYTDGIVMNENGTVYFRGTDAAGNISDVTSYVVSNIDQIAPDAPVVSADITEATNGSVLVSATFSADTVTKQYFNGTEWVTYTGAIKVDANNTTVQFRGIDAAGNISEVSSYTVTNIDKVAPTAPTATADTAVTNGDVTVTATFDTASDVIANQYSLDGVTWLAYTGNGVVMTANGTVYFRSIDQAGNISAISEYVVANIDKAAPALNITGSTIAPTNGNVTINAVASEDLASLTYSIVYADGTTDSGDYTGSLDMAQNGVITFVATDKAGNVTTGKYEVTNIDDDEPVINVSANVANDVATGKDVIVSAIFSDDAVVKYYKYEGESLWREYTGSIVVSENDTKILFFSKDAAGNEYETEYTVTNIDKTAPVISNITWTPDSATNSNVIVTADFGDADVKEYSLDGSHWFKYVDGVTMSGNGTVYFRATDAVGNVSVVDQVITNIDKIAPEAPVISVNTTAPVKGETGVWVTATFAEDSVVKQYSVGDGGWQTYTGEVKVTENGTIYFRSQDAAGNWSEVTSQVISNIDDKAPVAPVASADVTKATNGNVIVTGVFSSDSVLKEYQVVDASGSVIVDWTVYTGSIVVTANGTVNFRGTDEAGNVSAVGSYVVDNIDKTAPAVTNVTLNNSNLTNTDVTVTADFGDAAIKQYSLDGITWVTYTGGVVMSANGVISFRGIDAVGNVSEVVTQEITNIDKDAPALAISGNAADWTNSNVVLTALGEDGLDIHYSVIYEGESSAVTGIVSGNEFVMEKNGVITFTVTDEAGNTTTQTVIVSKIDKTAPAINVSGNAMDATNQDVVISATTDKDATLFYSLDNNNWITYTDGVVMSKNGIVYFKSVDKAGNETIETVTVDKIDKTAPVAPVVSADITDATNGKVTVSAEFSADSTVKEYSFDGKIWQTYTSGVEMTDNGTVYFRGTDEAGNTSESSYVVSNIDKVAPMTPSGAADITAATNGNVIVTGFFSSDSVKKEFKIVDAEGNVISDWADYSTPVVMVDNGTVIFRATDAAGNVSGEGSCVVSNIDKTAPAAPIAQADTAETQGNVTVYATFSTEADSIKQYSLDGSQWLSYNAENGVEMTANGTVWFREIDAAGNISGVTTYDVTNIDRNVPGAPVGYVEDTAVTDQPVTVYATFASDIVTKEYSLDGKTWYEYTDAGVVVKKNCNVYFRGTDAAGNVSPVGTYHVTNINYSTFSEYSMVEGVFEADAVKKEYSLNGYDWEEYTGDVKVTRTGTVFFRSTDASGVETINEKLVVTLNKDAKNDWNDLAQKGDKGEVISINGLDNKLDIDTVVTGNVGYADQNDYYSFDLATAAKLSFYVNSTDNVKFIIYKLVPKTNKAGVTTYSLKAIQTTTVKAGYTVPSVNKLLAEGTYYVRVMSNNKNGGDANYTISMKETTVFFDRGSDADDWKDVKTAGAKGAVDTTSISVINKPGQEVLSNGWVGYGDQDDYIQFSLDDAAKLNFNFSSSDGAYFRIYKLVEKVNAKTGVKTYSLKWVQTTTVRAGYSVMSKDLLLDKGTYYFRVTSSNASKGGNAEYDISLNEISKFFTKGDKATDGVTALNDDWTDVKSKGATSAELDKNSIGKLTKDSKVNGWVGFGDTSDYMEFKLDTAANISFDVTSSDATRVVIYKLVENKNGTYTLKALQATTLSKLANGTGYSKTTKGLNMAAGTYYVRVYSTNAAKGGDASYSLSVNTATRFYAEAGDNTDDTWKLAQATDSTMLKKNADTALNGWVGYSDASDYEKLQLDESGKVTLKLDAATAQAIDNKELKITVLDEKGKAVAMTWNTVNDTFTSKLSLADDAICYVGVSTTSASKYETEYKITAGIIVG